MLVSAEFSMQEIETIRGVAAQMDRERRAAQALLDIIYDHRLFKLFVPDEWGGRMMTVPEATLICQELGSIDGAAGWIVGIGVGGGYFAPFMDAEFGRRVFSPREAVIAGSGMPGEARPVEGGYIVDGIWHYASGSHYATTFTANVAVKRSAAAEPGSANNAQALEAARSDAGRALGQADKPLAEAMEEADLEIISVALRPEQVQIVDDWDAAGMRATDSNTIYAKEEFVPDAQVFHHLTAAPSRSELAYKFPFIGFGQSIFGGVVLGTYERYLEAAESSARKRDKHGVVDAIIAARAELVHVSKHFHKVVDHAWQELEERGALSDHMQAEIDKTVVGMTDAALETAFHIQRDLGLSAMLESSEINRCWRDLQTGSSHMMVRRKS